LLIGKGVGAAEAWKAGDLNVLGSETKGSTEIQPVQLFLWAQEMWEHGDDSCQARAFPHMGQQICRVTFKEPWRNKLVIVPFFWQEDVVIVRNNRSHILHQSLQIAKQMGDELSHHLHPSNS
jgi:hypothetical protein